MPPPIDTEEAARRLARVIVSDIQLYNGAQIAAGQDVSMQIKEGFHHFVGRVAPQLHDVFHAVLAERGLAGPKAAAPKAAAPIRSDSPTPVAVVSQGRGHTPPPEASARRWDEGAGPERVTPKVLSVTPPIPVDVAEEEDAEQEFSDAPTAVAAPPPSALQEATPPPVLKPHPPAAPPLDVPRPAPLPPAPTPASSASLRRAPSDPVTPPPLPVAAARPREAAPQPAPVPRAPVPVPAVAPPAASWPQTQPPAPSPVMARPFAETSLQNSAGSHLEPMMASGVSAGSEGPVPNLKPPFPWFKLILFVGAVVAAVGALMVMVTR